MKRYNIFTQTLLWLFVACMSAMTGCVQDEEMKASFDTTILKYDAAAQNIPYTIKSNGEWTITSDSPSWCTTSVGEGNGTTGIDIVLLYNGTSVERTAILTLKSGSKSSTLKIVQSAQLCSLAASPLALAAGVDAESFDIAVTSNTEWTATTEDSWIDLTGVSSRASSQRYSGNGILHLTAAKNDTHKERTGTITIYAQSNDGSETLTKTVVVSQSANSTASIVLSSSSLNFASSDTAAKSVEFYGTASDLSATTDDSWCTAAVSGSTITVTPTANSTSSASRFAVVTVTATVNGEAATAQIVVTQDGASAPEIYLYNNSYSVSASATSVSLNWLNLTATNIESVTATDAWATATKVDNSSATVSFVANEEVKSRSTTIRIAYKDLLDNMCYKEIQLTQSGVGAPNIYYNDLSLTADAITTPSTLRIIVDNASATVGTVAVKSGWLTVTNTPANAGGVVEVQYTHSANYSDSNRETTITVPISVGSTLYLCNVNVTQNGLGSPEISTPMSVHVGSEAQTHAQSLWITGGDSESVTYTVTTTYSSTANTADEDWVTSAIVNAADNETLEVTLLQNTLNEARSAVITVVAKRGASTSTIDVLLTQAGTATAGVVGLSQEIYHNYEAAMDVELAFELINNSSATVVSYTAGMFTAAEVTATPTLKYSISEYTGGESGSYRDGIITLKVTNDNEYPVYYDVLVRQTAPENPSVDTPDVVYIPYTAVSTTTLPINLLNSAKIDTSAAATYLWGTTDTDWLTVTLTETGVTYAAEAYTGGEGESRSVVVSFYVTNSSANDSLCSIEFVQGESDAATASVPKVVTVGYAEATNSFDVTLSNTAGANLSTTADYAEDNIGLFANTPSVSGTTVSFDVTKNTTTTQRSGHVIVTVSGTNSYDKSVYYVPVTQLTADEVVITAPTSTLSYGNVGAQYSFPISTTYSGTVSATSSDTSWLTVDTATALTTAVDITLTDYVGNEEYREAFITLAVEAANSSEKNVIVTVRQYKDGSAFVLAPSAISVGAAAFSVDVPYSVNEDAETTTVTATSDFSMTATDATTSVTVAAGENVAASSREGYVAITVANNSSETYTHYITLTQAGTEDATADVPSTINVAHAGETGISINTSNIQNVVSAELTEVSDADAMVSITTASDLTAVLFDVAQNTSLEARYAVLKLTVTGVNGNVAVYYINVNQAGAPDITLAVPATVYVGSTAATVSAPFTTSETATAVSSETWLTATVNGANIDIATTSDNTAADSREAYITVTATNAAGESISEIIVVTQAGTEDATASVPTTVNVVAAGATVNLAATFADVASATLAEVGTSGMIAAGFATDVVGGTIEFTVEANTSLEARSTIMSVTVVGENGNTSIYYINVNQAGAPDITLAVPATVYVGSAATTVSAPFTTSETATAVSSEAWLTATVNGANVDIETISDNTAADSREAYITVTAENAAGESISEVIVVTQAGTEDATASVPSTINVGYKGESVSLAAKFADATSATLAEEADASNMITAGFATDVLGGTIAFTVEENTSTEERFAIMSVTVTGANNNVAIYYINVNQAGAPDIMLSVPAAVSISAASIAPLTLPISYSTSATKVTAARDANSTWLTVNSASDSSLGVVFTTSANSGQATPREGYITVTAENAAGESVSDIITVTQAGTADATADVPSTISVSAAGESFNIAHTIADVQSATLETVTASSTMITGVTADATSSLNFSVEANASVESRSELLKLSVEGTNGKTNIYYINVEQKGASDIVLSVPAVVNIPSDITTGAIKIPVTAANIAGGSVSAAASSDGDWLSVTTPVVTASGVEIATSTVANTTASPREGYITVTATNAAGEIVVQSITVTQAGIADATADVPTTISVEAAAATALSVTSTTAAAGETFALAVESDPSAMLTNVAGTTFDVVANATTSIRTAILKFSVTGVNGNTTIYYINVVQAAAAAAVVPTLEVPAAISFGASEILAADALTLPVATNGTISVATTYQSGSGWLTATAGSADISIYAAENTGEARVAYVTVTAESIDGTTTDKIITVTQTGAVAAGPSTGSSSSLATVAHEVTLSKESRPNLTLDVAFSADASTTIAPVASIAYDTFAMITGVHYVGGVIAYGVTENTTGANRAATLALTTTGTDGSQSISYIVVNQTLASTSAEIDLSALGSSLSATLDNVPSPSKVSMESSSPVALKNYVGVVNPYYLISGIAVKNTKYIKEIKVSSSPVVGSRSISRAVSTVDDLSSSEIFSLLVSPVVEDDKIKFSLNIKENYGVAKSEVITVTIVSYSGDTDMIQFYVEQAKGPDAEFSTEPGIVKDFYRATADRISVPVKALTDIKAYEGHTITILDESCDWLSDLDYDPTTNRISGKLEENVGVLRSVKLRLVVHSKNGTDVLYSLEPMVEQYAADVAFVDDSDADFGKITGEALNVGKPFPLNNKDLFESYTVEDLVDEDGILDGGTSGVTYTKDGMLTLSVNANNGDAARTASFTIKVIGQNLNEVTKKFTVTQVALPKI